jgi:hypothetical protein
MLRALIEGKATTQEMAALAKGELRKKTRQREPALEGYRRAPSLLVTVTASATGGSRKRSDDLFDSPMTCFFAFDSYS